MKKIQILTTLIFFVCTLSVKAQSVLDKAKEKVEEGKYFLDNGNQKEALKVFDNAIRLSRAKPYKEGHPDIFMLVGDAFLNCPTANIEIAFAFYVRARDIEPRNKKYWEKLSNPIFDQLKKKKE
jgi:hypothetical protein